jgi:hypothetical protein
MKRLQVQLLNSEELGLKEGEGNPLGSYNPMKFVLRLRKDIHEALQELVPGVKTIETNPDEQQQAFSTYLHETIHWWQHAGSNFGLVSSLRYPSQAHRVWPDLIEIVKTLGCFKSIDLYHDKQQSTTGSNQPIINRVLNYWYDLEGGGALSFDPTELQIFLQSPSFVSVGHSAYILYSSAINCIASIVDQDLKFLPKADKWGPEFRKLQNQKSMWFDPEPSGVILPQFGTKAIFEGQARLSQLQYLYFSSRGQREFEEFKSEGLLNGIYTVALDLFLKTLDEELPKTPHNPLIGLFLLVCDIAINPTDGFPFEIYHFPSFYLSVDPGTRFHMLCMIIKDKYPFLKNVIVSYSKEEYVDLSMILCHAMQCKSPHDGAQVISNWEKMHPSIAALMKEEKQFKFQDTNMPVRLFLSKFIRFNQDKYEQPQIFCWPGASLIGLPTNKLDLKAVEEIFNRHKALFVDSVDGNVYAAVLEGISEKQLDETLNNFYSWNSIYDMVRQWIIETGPFVYDLRWLSKKYTQAEAKNWVCNKFVKVFGHHPDSFRIL